MIAHCGSLGKVLSAGLRLGWLVAHPDLLANATVCKQLSDANTSTFAQSTEAQYFKRGWIPRTLAGRRRRVHAAARRLVLLGAPDRRHGAVSDAGEFAKPAIEHGVAFVPGVPLYASEPDTSTLRLSFATADMAKIEKGVARLAKAL